MYQGKNTLQQMTHDVAPYGIFSQKAPEGFTDLGKGEYYKLA